MTDTTAAALPATTDARWAELMTYLSANIASLRDEAAAYANEGHDELATRLRHDAEVFSMIRAHAGEIEDEMVAEAAAREDTR